MGKKIAVLEMAAAIILMIVALFCFARTWSKTNELCNSLHNSADSYKVVVTDGKDFFKETYKTLPTHWKTLEIMADHLSNAADSLQTSSDAIGRFPIPNWWGTGWLNSFKEVLRDLCKTPIPTIKQIKDSLDACAKTLRDMHNEEKYDNICQAFDNTAKSLDHAKGTIDEVNKSFRSIMVIVLISVGICCSSMFCHGASRWRAITKQA